MKKLVLLALLVLALAPWSYAQFTKYIPPDANTLFSTSVDDAVVDGLTSFNYVGTGWVNAKNTTDPYMKNTVSYSKKENDLARFTFTGHTIVLYGSKAPHHGLARLVLDDGSATIVDLYSPTRTSFYLVLTARHDGLHTLDIIVTGDKNAAASDAYVIVDGADIYYSNPYNVSHTNTITGIEAAPAGGSNNSVYGYRALNSSGGGANVAVGNYALYRNGLRSYHNVAVGMEALYESFYGIDNVAVGFRAMLRNFAGSYNVALGFEALHDNGSGTGNVGIGYRAMKGYARGNAMTVIGTNAGVASAQHNIQNSTAIGNNSMVTASNQIRLGNSNVTSIGGQVSWSTLSDGRFKKDIKEDVSGLEFITKLRPVSYTVDKNAVDNFLRIPDSLRNNADASRKKALRQTGFVAQEVEALVKKTGYVFHGVEAPESDDEHYSIRYAEFVVPLVKAVQELNTHLKEKLNVYEIKIEELENKLKAFEGSSPTYALSEKETVLYQNNPNPFSTDTEIRMTLKDDVISATVVVYTLEGKQLKDFKVAGRGKTSVKISGSELNAGMYLYALLVDGKVVDTKRMILTK